MGGFGESLKREREIREITLEEVARGTKIPRHHLESLERNDLSRLPGGAFSRGYVRAYAQFIGLDPEIIVDEYIIEERAQGHGAPTAEETLQELSRMVNGWEDRQPGGPLLSPQVRRIAMVVLGVGVVAVMAWFLLPAGGEDSSPVTASPAPIAAAVPIPPAATPETASAAQAATDRQPPGPVESAPVASPPEPVVTRPETKAPPEAAVTTVATTLPEPPASRPAEPPAVASPPPQPAPAATIVTAPGPQAAGPTTTAQEQPIELAVTATEPDMGGGLTIPDFGVGTGVSSRQLVGQGDRFPEGTRVSFWTRVIGGQGGEMIRHVWIRDGKAVASVDLRVGGAHWRTHSRKTMRPGSAGSWTVEARDAAGRLLARSDFVCTSS